jgi:hypothetical protein
VSAHGRRWLGAFGARLFAPEACGSLASIAAAAVAHTLAPHPTARPGQASSAGLVNAAAAVIVDLLARCGFAEKGLHLGVCSVGGGSEGGGRVERAAGDEGGAHGGGGGGGVQAGPVLGYCCVTFEVGGSTFQQAGCGACRSLLVHTLTAAPAPPTPTTHTPHSPRSSGGQASCGREATRSSTRRRARTRRRPWPWRGRGSAMRQACFDRVTGPLPHSPPGRRPLWPPARLVATAGGSGPASARLQPGRVRALTVTSRVTHLTRVCKLSSPCAEDL